MLPWQPAPLTREAAIARNEANVTATNDLARAKALGLAEERARRTGELWKAEQLLAEARERLGPVVAQGLADGSEPLIPPDSPAWNTFLQAKAVVEHWRQKVYEVLGEAREEGGAHMGTPVWVPPRFL
tara:strand:+ start:30 stop:413 length:384 start_codon:yes stop_codon:yes gene_type:complete